MVCLRGLFPLHGRYRLPKIRAGQSRLQNDARAFRVFLMNPGRELDQFVATRVMGWEINGRGAVNAHGEYSIIPHYSTSIKDAWDVVEKLTENEDTTVEITPSKKNDEVSVSIRFYDKEEDILAGPFYFTRKTAPHAICLAALKSLGVQF